MKTWNNTCEFLWWFNFDQVFAHLLRPGLPGLQRQPPGSLAPAAAGQPSHRERGARSAERRVSLGVASAILRFCDARPLPGIIALATDRGNHELMFMDAAASVRLQSLCASGPSALGLRHLKHSETRAPDSQAGMQSDMGYRRGSYSLHGQQLDTCDAHHTGNTPTHAQRGNLWATLPPGVQAFHARCASFAFAWVAPPLPWPGRAQALGPSPSRRSECQILKWLGFLALFAR